MYSNFVYKPLTSTNVTNQAAVATATAQANANMRASYRVTVPGFGCDKGLGQWEPVTKENNYITARCQPDGLALSQDASTPYNGYASFYGLDGNLPTNYKVQVQIDTNALSNGCAGLMTRADMRAGGYNFNVCSNGYWQILRYDSSGDEGHRLAGFFLHRSFLDR